MPINPPRRWYDERGKCGILTCDDIKGAQPLSRYKAPIRATMVRDIRGAVPNACRALSDRVVDPMAPMYVLPSYVDGDKTLSLSTHDPTHTRQTSVPRLPWPD